MRAFDNDPVPSPCIQICKLDRDGVYCAGCNRTLDEIANWPNYTDEQKRHVWNRLDSLVRHKLRKHCEQCGAEFGCGQVEKSCWCRTLPAVLPLPLTAGDCLCPACLRAKLREEYFKREMTPPF